MTLLPIVKADAPDGAAQSTGCGCGGHGGCGGGGSSAPVEAQPGDIVVSTIPRGERHATIFAAVEALAPGEFLVIANDHAPEPLRAQLAAREPGQLTWEYLAEGPDVWRARIERVAGHCC